MTGQENVRRVTTTAAAHTGRILTLKAALWESDAFWGPIFSAAIRPIWEHDISFEREEYGNCTSHTAKTAATLPNSLKVARLAIFVYLGGPNSHCTEKHNVHVIYHSKAKIALVALSTVIWNSDVRVVRYPAITVFCSKLPHVYPTIVS